MVDTSFLSWPFFDDHHRTLAADLDGWATETLPGIVDAPGAHDDVDATCRALVKALGAGGWLRYAVPKAYGGMFDTLDVRSLCLIRETLARHSGLADFVFAMQGLGSGAITLGGSEETKAAYLPLVASGEKIAAFALTEPEAGSDVASIATGLTDVPGGLRVSGHKTYISNGGIADFYCVFARSGEADGARGLSAAVVDADTPGLEIEERIEVIAPHPLARLFFQGCTVPAGNLLGARGGGFKLAMQTLDIFRSTVGAAALGFARRALDEAVTHTKSRVLFGKPLAEQPITQERLAEMALDVDASALLIYRAAWTKDSGAPRVTREAAMAKLHATDQAQTVIDKALQMFGGLGVTHGVKVEELYREIRALRIYEGASEVQKLVIARQLLSE
ncbi:acyl-CoA dehydrogenase family protein [Kordiimonas marina]|uniref:acyl-CoA dehydrogenase family protein n=1 Tax=Kordiimonas marina TaxID=2872312 RepID=UPI001FF3491C|nr:acyl-CoA dehydrogenase family protein [Kordiimonas marina]MCJ9429959.1 acyl-CoA dehydrogenase family protein [Kordiimonas marina]